jgi:hypothetical protein
VGSQRLNRHSYSQVGLTGTGGTRADHNGIFADMFHVFCLADRFGFYRLSARSYKKTVVVQFVQFRGGAVIDHTDDIIYALVTELVSQRGGSFQIFQRGSSAFYRISLAFQDDAVSFPVLIGSVEYPDGKGFLQSAGIAVKAAEDAAQANKGILEAIKDALNGKVKAVKTSAVLKDHPVALSSEGPVSIEMEKVLRNMPGNDGVISEKILEINENHSVFAALKQIAADGNSEKLALYAGILYEQARLIEGLSVEDPIVYAKAVCSLLK